MHLTEDDLVLHYYGELGETEERHASAHLAECTECRREFTRLQRVLRTIDESALASDLPESFERTVWARLEPNLRSERPRWFSFVLSPAALALAAVVLVLVGAAFFAGRMSSPAVDAPVNAENADAKVRERILLVDLGEHLDRSQMVLVELVTKDGGIDISGEPNSCSRRIDSTGRRPRRPARPQSATCSTSSSACSWRLRRRPTIRRSRNSTM
jgi:hypothetical protein